MSRKLLSLVGLSLFSAACGDPDGLSAVVEVPGVTFHALDLEASCFTPAPLEPTPAVVAEPSPPESTDAVLGLPGRRPDLEQSASSFAPPSFGGTSALAWGAMFTIQRYAMYVRGINANTGRAAFSFQPFQVGAYSAGLSSGGSVPSNYGGNGVLALPGRPPELATNLSGGYAPSSAFITQTIHVTLLSASKDAARYQLTVTTVETGLNVTTTTERRGVAWTTPTMSGIEIGGDTVEWNDNFISVHNALVPGVAYHRGCDPRNGDSFESRFSLETYQNEMSCWSVAGEKLDCSSVDLTPG